MLTLEQNVLTADQRTEVINMLVEKCLFNQANAKYEGHITQNIDVTSLTSATMNKCHTSTSRKAAYKLFRTVIGLSSDLTQVKDLMAKHWAPLIMQLQKPKESLDVMQA
jgi:hypothetical protein